MPILKNFLDTTFKKILLISIVFVFTTSLFFFFYVIPHISETLMEERKQMISEMTNFLLEVFQELEEQEKNGQLKNGEAQQIAIETIHDYFYGNSNYFFAIDINNTRMIAHPNDKRLDETMINDVDAVGYELGKDILKNAQGEENEFYLPYKWEKVNSNEVGQKISYFKKFEPWGWIIGTGIYVDDINEEVASITQKIISVFSFILILMIGLLIYIINTGAKIEKQKNELELQFMSLIKKLPIGIFRLKLAKDGRGSSPIIWNDALMDLFKFPSKNFPETKIFHLQDLLVNQEDRIEIVAKAKNHTLIGDEYEMRTFTGEVLWIRLFGYVTQRASQTFFDASIEDVTESHKADELLKKSYIELQKTNSMKNKIISITSHELRAPLITIQNLTSLLTDKHTENLNKKQTRYAQKIKKKYK